MMTDREKLKRAVQRYTSIESNQIISFTLIGVEIPLFNYFFGWLEAMNKKWGIAGEDWLDTIGPDNLFNEILKKNDITLPYVWLHDEDTLMLEKEWCYVGVCLDKCNEALSVKRILIDVRKDLEKIQLLIGDDIDPDVVQIINDQYFYIRAPKKEEEKK